MNRWRIIYDRRRESYMICFDSFHECMKWLRFNIERLRRTNVKIILIDESDGNIWHRRHEHKFTNN